ncbi:LysR family transcriptional regulator [Faecalibacterium gallinarum]|nr:LysR family transcriptional regulator [Faecalibacterium gallinarum]
MTYFRGETMSIPYDYYRIFYYVARYQSLTRAAHALQSNQPNVTRTINALERELGCRLFQRSHRGVTLTPEGEKLFAHVQIMQEQLQAAEYELAGSRSLQSGSVSIGASETALHGLLLPVLRRFRQQHPGVRFQITNHSSPQAVAALRAGLVELAVVCTPCDEISKPLAEIPLRPTQDVLVAGPEYADLAARPLTLQEVADLPLVCLGPGSSTYTFFGQLFAQQGLTLSPDIQAATADQILPMVRYGLGLGFVPMELARGPLEKGEVIQLSLDQPIPARWISLVKDKSRPLSVAALELEKTLRAAAREG